MKCAPLFGLIALLPAALNAAPPKTNSMLLVPLCSGGTISLPLAPTPHDGEGGCDKACHAGCPRKRSNRLY